MIQFHTKDAIGSRGNGVNEAIRNLAVELFAETFGRLFIAPLRAQITDLTRYRRVGQRPTTF